MKFRGRYLVEGGRNMAKPIEVYTMRLIASDGGFTALDLSQFTPDEIPKVMNDFEGDMKAAGLGFSHIEYAKVIQQ